jgi:hypothetical protein
MGQSSEHSSARSASPHRDCALPAARLGLVFRVVKAVSSRSCANSANLIVMRADRVELSWDEDKRKWLVRIEAGSEVIRRHCDQSRDADEQNLRAAAEQTVIDEGYEIEPSRIAVIR